MGQVGQAERNAKEEKVMQSKSAVSVILRPRAEESYSTDFCKQNALCRRQGF